MIKPATIVTVLFARQDSVYKTMPNTDVYDISRDARTWTGNTPVIAHPPCRAWGRLRTFANPRPDEKQLAVFAVDQVRRCGGCLEHPASSTLWSNQALPLPGQGRDDWGGWTMPVDQNWFGHRAQKATWLYIVGIDPNRLPPYPLTLGLATHVIGTPRPGPNGRKRPEITKAEREHTPREFAEWLLLVASQSRPK